MSSIVDVTTVGDNCGCATRLSLRFLGASTSYIVVMTVLRRLDAEENTSKEGRADMGVIGAVLVVGCTVARSDGNGPITVGYCPVQYDTVVCMLGVGKTKLMAVSPYDMTFVVMARASNVGMLSTGEVLSLVVDNPAEGSIEFETLAALDEEGINVEPVDKLRDTVVLFAKNDVVSVWMLMKPDTKLEEVEDISDVLVVLVEGDIEVGRGLEVIVTVPVTTTRLTEELDDTKSVLLLLLEDVEFHIVGKELKAFEVAVVDERGYEVRNPWEEVDDGDGTELLVPRVGGEDVLPRDVVATAEPDIGMGEFVVVTVEVRLALLVPNLVVAVFELRLTVVLIEGLEVGRDVPTENWIDESVGEVEANTDWVGDMLDDTDEAEGLVMLPLHVPEFGEDDADEPALGKEVTETSCLDDGTVLRSLVGLGSDTVNAPLLLDMFESGGFV